MRLIVLFLVFAFSESIAFGHDSHFGFAEIEYNNLTQTVQATISLSTEDFERAISRKNNNYPFRISAAQDNKLLQLTLADEVLNYFQCSLDNEACKFELIGIEVTLKGITHFYFESQKINRFDTISILFANLVQDYPEQQNKVTLILDTKKTTLIFTQPKTQTIYL